KKVAGIPLGTEPGKITRSGGNLFVPCADHRLLRVDLSENKIAQTYAGHSDWVLTAQVQPSMDAEVGAKDSPAAERRATLQEQPSESATQASNLLSSSFDGELRLWNMADGTSIRNWQAKP
ncbi:MAG: hypothetical protein KDA51_01190, partial [Planctomycetales bacterium]|nr:hypothetical protein [Planctomycetales bacterium]